MVLARDTDLGARINRPGHFHAESSHKLASGEHGASKTSIPPPSTSVVKHSPSNVVQGMLDTSESHKAMQSSSPPVAVPLPRHSHNTSRDVGSSLPSCTPPLHPGTHIAGIGGSWGIRGSGATAPVAMPSCTDSMSGESQSNSSLGSSQGHKLRRVESWHLISSTPPSAALPPCSKDDLAVLEESPVLLPRRAWTDSLGLTVASSSGLRSTGQTHDVNVGWKPPVSWLQTAGDEEVASDTGIGVMKDAKKTDTKNEVAEVSVVDIDDASAEDKWEEGDDEAEATAREPLRSRRQERLMRVRALFLEAYAKYADYVAEPIRDTSSVRSSPTTSSVPADVQGENQDVPVSYASVAATPPAPAPALVSDEAGPLESLPSGVGQSTLSSPTPCTAVST